MSKRRNKRRSKGGKRYPAAQPTPQHNTTLTIRPQPAPALEPGQEWHAIYTAPRGEFRLAESLTVRGVAVYLPVYGVATGRAGREVERPYLPRYLFAAFGEGNFPPLDRQDGRWICDPDTLRPLRIPRHHIEALAGMVFKAAAEAQEPTFAVGQGVAIAEGPLAGLRGSVAALDAFRVKVLVQTPSGVIPVALPLRSVQSVVDTSPHAL